MHTLVPWTDTWAGCAPSEVRRRSSARLLHFGPRGIRPASSSDVVSDARPSREHPPLQASDASAPWWRSPFLLVVATCVGLIYVFVHFASEVVERETRAFDHAVRDWVFAHRPPWLVHVFGVTTLLGDRRLLIVVAAIVAIALARGGARVRPLLVAALPFCLSATARLLREWYQIPRPPAGLLTSALAFGFPSGHTSSSTAVAIVVAYVLARERGARRLAWTIAIVMPLAVGISRVYLDMHWASDVIGGWLIGVCYAVAVCALYEHALRRARARSSTSCAS